MSGSNADEANRRLDMSETTPSEFFAMADRKAAFPATHTAMEQVAILLDYSPVALLIRAVRSGCRLIATCVVEPVFRRRRQMVTVHSLSRLSDHQLRDIGLTRAEIHAAALSIFEREE
jgi:uncharacterized protein YjiS (DUF1127 family)